jgi:2-dehydro-3-deoxyphosphogluconate aldolase/(4S)-4-hydroxy-2-oxoglutarate aldolase
MKRLTKTEVLQKIREIALIPIIRVDTPELAHRAVLAIRRGGISILEITMTVPGALRVIEELSAESPEGTLIGAGTVFKSENARECIQAGAQFIVTPSLNAKTIEYCNHEDVVILPGAMTPTEIVSAWTMGADLVKIFPAGEVGGPGFIKALKGPLPHIKMVPTGGVTLATAKAFLEAGSEAVGIGGDLVDVAALKQGKDDYVADRARQFVEIVRQVRGVPAEITAGRSGA